MSSTMTHHKMDKKGFVQKMIVVLIIMLVTITILATFIYQFKTSAKSYLDRTLCRDSILAVSLTKPTQKDFFRRIECDTIKVEIDGEATVQKAALAKLFTDTWFQFREGKKPLLKNDGQLCIVAADVTITKDIQGFYTYLFEERPPRQKKTYMEYLTNGQDGALKEAILQRGIDLDTAKIPAGEYTLLFLYDQTLTSHGGRGPGSKSKAVSDYQGSSGTKFWEATLSLTDQDPPTYCKRVSSEIVSSET